MATAWLTIDDGASENTPRYLDFLDKRGIEPVMFFWGQRLETHWQEGLLAVRRGVMIANHTYSHPAMSELSFEQAVADIEKMDAMLEKLYNEAGMTRKAKMFRFPYGDTGGDNAEKLQAYLRDNGYVSLVGEKGMDVWMSFDLEEYRLPNDETFHFAQILEHIQTLKDDGAHHVVLIHDHPETESVEPMYFERLIDAMINVGVHFTKPELQEK